MDHRRRTLLAGAATVGIFLLVQVGGLAVVEPFLAADLQPVEDTSNPANSVLYFLAILAASGLMLLVIKYDLEWIIRGFVLFGTAVLSWYVLAVFLPWPAALVGALALGVALFVYPEWYVIDVAGILMGAGAAGVFGITFGVLPALVLLVILAVYDAISVYGTEHMLTLAEGAMDMRIPVMFVVPTTLSYSFLDDEPPAEVQADPAEDGGSAEYPDGGSESGDGEGPAATGTSDEPPSADDVPGPVVQDALFVGVGDAVIPTVMVTSAVVTFPDAPAVAGPVTLTLPGLTSIVGILLGLCALLWFVFRGRAHAGLPLLNGGAILGYVVGALASGIPLLEALGLATYF